MITLPASPALQHVDESPIDFGFLQRPPTGGPATRIDRPGLRTAAEFQLPTMPADTARVFATRISKAKSEVMRVPWPLMGVSQGSPGNPVVNGSGASGTSLPVRGVTNGYTFKEGWFLNVIDSAGVYYFHRASASVVFPSGTGTVPIWPPLRAELSDGDTVVMDDPQIEGLVTAHSPLPRSTDYNVSLSFTLEEIA